MPRPTDPPPMSLTPSTRRIARLFTEAEALIAQVRAELAETKQALGSDVAEGCIASTLGTSVALAGKLDRIRTALRPREAR